MKNVLIALALVALSGMCNGLHETLHYHYGRFQSLFPSADQNYWNPAVSWKCKYQDGDPAKGPKFPLSTSVLVAFTDAKHLLSELHRDTLALGMWFFGYWYRSLKSRRHFALIMVSALALWCWHAAFFHLIYSLIF